MEKPETIMASMMEISRDEKSIDISEPLQNLFDECLNFISINDFNM